MLRAGKGLHGQVKFRIILFRDTKNSDEIQEKISQLVDF